MSSKNHSMQMFLLLITALSLAACGAQAAPMATNIPVTRTPTIGNASEFEGLSTNLDNAKQARIRVVSGVMGAPNVDVYINGLPVVNGGRVQQNIGVGSFSGWVYVTPGTYTVELVPHGQTVEQAIFAPVAVNAETGHRYTVAAMGQLKERNVRPLVVDETTLEASTGPKATDAIYITINNLKGLEGLDLRHDGKVLSSTKYGVANVAVCASY